MLIFFNFLLGQKKYPRRPGCILKRNKNIASQKQLSETKDSVLLPDDIKPSLKFTNEARGCGSFMVYKLNDSHNETIFVSGARKDLKITTKKKAFKLENNSEHLKVEVKRFNGDASGYYCNDILDENLKVISTWKGTKGTVEIQIVRDRITTDSRQRPTYTINVTLKNIELKNKNGKKIFIDYIEFKNVYVGWWPG